MNDGQEGLGRDDDVVHRPTVMNMETGNAFSWISSNQNFRRHFFEEKSYWAKFDEKEKNGLGR